MEKVSASVNRLQFRSYGKWILRHDRMSLERLLDQPTFSNRDPEEQPCQDSS